MLHEPTDDGGLGFCHDAIPAVLPPGYHGPLVVALDSNILIDLEHHGDEILDGEMRDGLDEGYVSDLESLGSLLELWLLRDIRFVVTPTSLVDAKRMTARFTASRVAVVEALAASLAFQFGDWANSAPSEEIAPLRGDESGLPDGADRELVLEAQAIGAHVFLTRDQRVVNRVNLSGPSLIVCRPIWLASELHVGGVTPWLGGVCSRGGCPYEHGPLLAPDLGKWTGLLSVLGCDD